MSSLDMNSTQLLLGGIRIDALEQSDLTRLLVRAKSLDERILILNHNLHSLYLHETDPAFQAFYSKASYVYIDGMPIVWIGRAAGLPLKAEHRITFLDSFETFLEEAAGRGWRVFYLGSTAEVLTTGIALLRRRYPNLKISGCHGFFDRAGNESSNVISQINDYEADMLFVGMGMPVQEMWLAENYARINVPAILTSGATLDYVTGQAYRPPAWAGKLGLYGFMRMCSEPKRLWRRYLIEPLILAKLLAPRLIRERQQSRKRMRDSLRH